MALPVKRVCLREVVCTEWMCIFFADIANAEYHAPPAYSIKFRKARTEDS
jgi:hypothetical protein